MSAHLSVFFRNIETGLCLDSNGTQIYTHVCNGGDWQLWDVTYGGTYIEVRNRRTALCLDSNYAGQVYPHVCNGGLFQRWQAM